VGALSCLRQGDRIYPLACAPTLPTRSACAPTRVYRSYNTLAHITRAWASPTRSIVTIAATELLRPSTPQGRERYRAVTAPAGRGRARRALTWRARFPRRPQRYDLSQVSVHVREGAHLCVGGVDQGAQCVCLAAQTQCSTYASQRTFLGQRQTEAIRNRVYAHK
jgi:hypothetical protein